MSIQAVKDQSAPVVLIIEDEPGDAHLVQLQLLEKSAAAYQVFHAETLADARSLLMQDGFSPDIVLLDLNLPDSTGTPTVSRCRQLFPNVPIVVLTGLEDVEATIAAIEAGADDYLAKSSDAESIRKALNYALLRHERDRSERLALTVFHHAREGIMITDQQGVLIEVNPAFTRITGHDHDAVIGLTPRILSSGHHDAAFYQTFWDSLEQAGFWEGELWNRRKNGEIYVQHAMISAVRDAAGRTTQYVCLFTDVTERKEQQTQLEHLAHFDALTDLPNRVLFNYRLSQSMAYAQRYQRRIAVAYLDLDLFKPINDEHGHAAGDLVLQIVAKRMSECLRDEDTLARLGGDEFALVLEMADHLDQVTQVLKRLLQAVSTPIQWKNETFRISASIGVSVFPQPVEVSAHDLLHQADLAMYRVKNSGRNCYCFYNELDASDAALL